MVMMMMSMSRQEELSFLISILSDLKCNYPSHNERVLQSVIDILEYRLESEERHLLKT